MYADTLPLPRLRVLALAALATLAPAAPREGIPRMQKPIDTSLFVAGGMGVSSFVREATLRAPVENVYRAWTDPESWRRAYDPDRAELQAEIDLVIGGRYEWLWDGEIGSNGCQVLSFVPNRMLSFSWNAPPTQPESRAKRTWVVVDFEPRGDDATHVRITHLGFGEGPEWEETRSYFEKAWPHVLSSFAAGLEG